MTKEEQRAMSINGHRATLIARERAFENKIRKLVKFIDDVGQTIKQEHAIQYTGWFALVRKIEDRWETVGTINPDLAGEGECEWFETTKFDLILPIPDPETVPEFEGF